MTKVFVGCIRLYQALLSPMLVAIGGHACRFHPSCSQYAVEAIQKHGPFRGIGYAIRRILRCQPFCEGGYDPVP